MQVIFDFILMGNQDVAFGTITAGIVQVDRVERIYVNQQRHFLLRGLAFALWTAGKAHVAIRVEEEFIARRKFAKEGGFVRHVFCGHFDFAILARAAYWRKPKLTSSTSKNSGSKSSPNSSTISSCSGCFGLEKIFKTSS